MAKKKTAKARTTLELPAATMRKLKALAKQGHRTISGQVAWMIEREGDAA